MTNGNLIELLLSIPAVLLSLTLHECAHALIALRLGDPTARDLGRLTLNPIRHVDPLGALSLLLFRIGWAKPVPVNPRNFRRPRADMALTALAGPVSNLLIAFFSVPVCLAIQLLLQNLNLTYAFPSENIYRFFYYLFRFFFLLHLMNLALTLFNLLPLTPLDGSRILYLLLPKRACVWFIRHEKQIYIFVLLWLVGGSFLSDLLLTVPAIGGNPVLSVLVSFLSLTGWIEKAVLAISSKMFALFRLIPIFS